MPKLTDVKKVLVIGSGPIIIGQAAEFDYAGTQACRALKEEGFEVVLDENSPTIYITSINGVEQTNDAGWVYKIDDEITMDEASDIILTEGMEVTWEYMSWSDF